MSDTVLIDLGEDRAEPAVDRQPPPVARRRVLRVVLALLLVVGLGGSAAISPTLVETRLPGRLGDLLDVRDDRMYVVGPQARVPGVSDRAIAAYHLPDGRLLWQAALPVTAQVPGQIYNTGGTLLLLGFDTSGVEVIVLDENSGALIWRRLANFFGVAPGLGGSRRVLLGMPADTGSRSFEQAPDHFEAVDLRTGATVWTYRRPAGAEVWPVWRYQDDLVARMVVSYPSGKVEVRDLATGGLVASAVLRGLTEPVEGGLAADADSPDEWLSAADDLVLAYGTPRAQFVTAYGLERLDKRWSVPWEGGFSGGYLGSSCGSLLCVVNPNGEVRAVERDTGRQRWQASWLWVRAWGSLLLASGERGSAEAAELALLDPETGRIRHALGDWSITGLDGGDRLLVVHRDVAGSRAWFGLLDQRYPAVRMLGVVTGVAGGECQGGRDSVVCRRIDGSLGIWRYR